jgi:hypothetical protein
MSLAGVQTKLAVSIDDVGRVCIPMNGSPRFVLGGWRLPERLTIVLLVQAAPNRYSAFAGYGRIQCTDL